MLAVIIHRTAQRDMEQILHYAELRAPTTVRNWFERLTRSILSLAKTGASFSRAPEASKTESDLR